MKVQIISDDGDVLFERSPSADNYYDAEGEALYRAIIAETLWIMHSPKWSVPVQDMELPPYSLY